MRSVVVKVAHNLNSGAGRCDDRAGAPGDALDEAFELLVERLVDAPLGHLQARFGRWRSRMDAVEARRLATRVGADGDLSPAADAAGAGGQRSRASARRAAKRAAAIKENPELADQLEAGELATEQLDSIADAMATDPAAAHDPELIEGVRRASVDQGRRLARRWAANAAAPAEVQSEHDRQCAARRASSYDDATLGMSVLRLEGDRSTIRRLWDAIQAEARRLYEADGGRDVAASEHLRTREQRLFDAAVQVLSGKVASSGTRPSVVIDLPVSKLLGADVCAELIGHGPLPDSVLAEILHRAELWLQITGACGQPLWLGRGARHANRAQLISLVTRDRGCALCGARWNDCEAHHLLPWHAPGRGRTDVDNLALLCVGCHHRLHANNQTLWHDHRAGTWHTRPATPNETPPRRSESHRPGRGRQPRRREPTASTVRTGPAGAHRQRTNRTPRGNETRRTRRPTSTTAVGDDDPA